MDLTRSATCAFDPAFVCERTGKPLVGIFLARSSAQRQPEVRRIHAEHHLNDNYRSLSLCSQRIRFFFTIVAGVLSQISASCPFFRPHKSLSGTETRLSGDGQQ